MSVLRKIIYLIIFSEWSNVMIAHSLGVDQSTIENISRWLKGHIGKLHIIVSMGDDELAEEFSEYCENKVQEDVVVYKFKNQKDQSERGACL